KGYVAGLIVLGIALLAEGGSLLRALHQVRRQGGTGDGLRDPALRTVVAEDGTAVVGVTLAIVGMALHMATGQVVWEAGASVAIGLLLVYVAYRLGREARDRLIGEAVDPEASERHRELLRAQPEIDSVEALLTMQTGLDSVLVAARVDLVPGMDSERVEEVAVRIKRTVAEAVPAAEQIFLDVTDRGAPEAREAWESPAATGERGGASDSGAPPPGASCTPRRSFLRGNADPAADGPRAGAGAGAGTRAGGRGGVRGARPGSRPARTGRGRALRSPGRARQSRPSGSSTKTGISRSVFCWYSA